jgi:hypothetical protein
MAKSSKKSKEATPPEVSSAAPGMESNKGIGNTASVKPVASKKARAKSAEHAKAGSKSRIATPRKSAAGRKPRAKAAQPSIATGNAAVTDEEIRTRAYFISEWRKQRGIAGDSANDWLEARRQLREEAGKRG